MKLLSSTKIKLASALAVVGSLVTAAATHAQVTFSATAPQAALQSVADGTTDFFWDNAPGVLMIGVSIGIVIGFVGWLIAKMGGKKRMSGRV